MANIQDLWQKHQGQSAAVYNVSSDDEVALIMDCPTLPEGVFLSDWIGCGKSLQFMPEDRAVFDYYVPDTFEDMSLLKDFSKRKILARKYLKSSSPTRKRASSFYAIESSSATDGLSVDKGCLFSEQNFIPQLLCYLGYSKIYLFGDFLLSPQFQAYYETECGVKFYHICKFF